MTLLNKFVSYCLFLALLAGYGNAFAAITGVIRGSVIDIKTKEPLQAVNIVVQGTVRGASTDGKGQFIIQNMPPGVFTLRASMIGYRTITIADVKVQPDRESVANFLLEETVLEYDPIVVLAGKMQQRLDQTSVSMSVVTSKDIERRNPTSIIEALETAPGVNFIGDQINIRGSTGFTFGAGNKTLLLLDGVPVYASDTGAFNWDMLPPLDIEQIEVLKGAGSTLWGSSALGGVVNIITKDPSPEGELLFAYSAAKNDKPYYSEWEWTDPDRLHYTREDMSYSKRLGNMGFRISGSRFFSTGHTELGDFKKYNLTGKVDYRFKNGIKVMAYTAYSNINKGFFLQWKGQNDPYQVDVTNLSNRGKVNQISIYTKIAIPLSARFAINARASLNRSLLGNQFGRDADFNPAYGQGGEIQADWIPYPGHVITFGTQYQSDKGSTKYFGEHEGFFLGPFIQDEWKARENLRITTGVRYDRYKLVKGEKEDLFSPRFGINWQPWPTTSLRGSVGSGFRAATIIERFLELSIMNFKVQANPDLKSESSWAYDLGVRQYINQDWNVDVSFFRNDYWELIEAHLDLIRGQIQFRNIPRARIQGIEATTNFSYPVFLFGVDWTPGIQASITWMDHEDLKYHQPLTYRPNILSTIKTSLKAKNTTLQVDYRYASEIDEVKIYPINDRVPMKFVDLRLDYDWGPLTVQLGVINLFQYNYAPRETDLMPMRTYTVGLKGRI
ncbi:MAG TPA: TonB-dependent receptor [bacterium]|nr:TonB-dependent receptor [bacterium]HPN42845.1 TonB-dependent receptor [bacterium]